MSVSRIKTWIAEILTAADLNAEFNNILNNGEDLGWPATKAKDLNGFELILDADADSSVTANTDDRIDIKVGGTDAFMIGHAAGNTGSFMILDPGAFAATANTDIGRFRVGNSAALTVPAGTTALAAGLIVEEPNLTATGTITTAATVFIGGAPTEGAANHSLLVNAGSAKFNGNVLWSKGGDIASADPLVIDTDGNIFDITGTTDFTAFTIPAGMFFVAQFDGILTMTHNATTLILPGGRDIKTAAGDVLIGYAHAANQVTAISFLRAAGRAFQSSTIISTGMSSGTLAAGSTTFLGPTTSSSNEGFVDFRVPYAGTIKNLYTNAGNFPGAGETFVYTVRKNAGDTAVTVTVSDGVVSEGEDTTNTVAVAAGDTITVKIVVSGSGNVTTHQATFELQID